MGKRFHNHQPLLSLRAKDFIHFFKKIARFGKKWETVKNERFKKLPVYCARQKITVAIKIK